LNRGKERELDQLIEPLDQYCIGCLWFHPSCSREPDPSTLTGRLNDPFTPLFNIIYAAPQQFFDGMNISHHTLVQSITGLDQIMFRSDVADIGRNVLGQVQKMRVIVSIILDPQFGLSHVGEDLIHKG
jgi:hypothetical protein